MSKLAKNAVSGYEEDEALLSGVLMHPRCDISQLSHIEAVHRMYNEDANDDVGKYTYNPDHTSFYCRIVKICIN